MNVSEMNDVVESIRAKLSRGEILSPEDLEQLQPLLEFESSLTVKDGYSGSAPSVIPYLNRFMLNDTMPTTTPGPQLVRYVGMVQDMMDPEYYEIKDDKGRSTHFRDYLEETSNAEETIMTEEATVIPPDDQYSFSSGERPHCDLAERIPLVLVPIPFASEWFRQLIQPKANNSVNSVASASSPKSVVDPPRKRARDFVEKKASGNDDNNETLDTYEVEPSKQVKSEDPNKGGITAKSTSNDNVDNSSCNDWWPAGSCGTSHEDCPILAKFSYDQLLPQPPQQEAESPFPQSRRRLLLNDLVSVVGVLSMNPWEADFSQQRRDDNLCSSMDEWMGSQWGGDPFAMTLPPPSRLPRLHVLCYQVLDLDDIVMEHLLSSSDDSSRHGRNADVDKTAASSFSPYCPDVLLRQFCGLNSSQSVAYSIWLCLLSKADRKLATNSKHERYEMIHVGPMERALGCLSLHVSMSDLDSSRAFFQHLAKNVLPQLCPVVATIDCTRKDELRYLAMGPIKDSNGRLRPCPLQLPAGSVLLIHYPPTLQSHNDNSAIKAVMDELVQHHRLYYRFEGRVVLPFEADYQIIVVSHQTQQFPCTVSIFPKGMLRGADIPPADMVLARKTLGRARSGRKRDGNKCQVTLSSSLTVRAQHDFLSRRKSIYESKQQLESQGVYPESVKPLLPGEDDFHRWLNTTKLLAKSRICSTHVDENQKWEATERDWEVALELNETLQ